MTLITVICFSNMLNFNGTDFKGLFIISLITLFPLLFLIQGILSNITNTNIFLCLGLSVLNFIILLLIYMNNSAYLYIFIYLAFGIAGYTGNKIIRKIKSLKK